MSFLNLLLLFFMIIKYSTFILPKKMNLYISLPYKDISKNGSHYYSYVYIWKIKHGSGSMYRIRG